MDVSLLSTQTEKSIPHATIKDSAIWQIFGGTLRTTVQTGDQEPEHKYEPAFHLIIDIEEDEATIDECLDSYFSPQFILDSKKKQRIKQ